MGSALIMLVSAYAFSSADGSDMGDPARIAAQVVSGIGFLGAGTIMRQGSTVSGLTTAARLWRIDQGIFSPYGGSTKHLRGNKRCVAKLKGNKSKGW